MAVNFAIHKVVTSLPGTLESDCLYMVRNGNGFDLYVTTTGASPVAVPLNQPQLHTVHFQGRWYLNTDSRWITWNRNYGPNNQNFNLSAGTAAEPATDWRNTGIYLPAGAQLFRYRMAGRASNNQVTAFNIRISHDTGPWFGGWDTNGETTSTTLFSADNVAVPTAGQGNYEFDLSATAATASDGYVKVYLQPSVAVTALRYLYTSCTLEYLLPTTGRVLDV